MFITEKRLEKELNKVGKAVEDMMVREIGVPSIKTKQKEHQDEMFRAMLGDVFSMCNPSGSKAFDGEAEPYYPTVLERLDGIEKFLGIQYEKKDVTVKTVTNKQVETKGYVKAKKVKKAKK